MVDNLELQSNSNHSFSTSGHHKINKHLEELKSMQYAHAITELCFVNGAQLMTEKEQII